MADDLEIHSYIHCAKCVALRQVERMEAGISTTGIVVQCRKHGLIAHWSVKRLGEQLALGPQCDCCPDGVHSN